ncbi:RNA polymerase sigma-70 factor, ECF subfamily [Flavobacteriaceae bacterium MAR_2010_188]|nr:RNA polymerase sigma-70 factor, ECF subfamily [Flavobacteriaceae bacterium MAR_2010_188]
MESEIELIGRLKSQRFKDEAFEELLKIYKQRLYWHIRHIIKSHEDTDDVLQNTFIKIYKNIEGFKGDSKLYSWMYRIATNESLTFLKKESKRMLMSNEEIQDTAINNLKADPYFEGDEIEIKLQKAIATLPPKQQTVFNMRYFEEIKYSEMSEILETSEGALKASFHLASKKIESYLKDN